MAERPWVTPEELKEYTEFEEVKNRADSKLKIDISRAESWVIDYCNNRFDDPEKYPEIPENVKTAVLLIAEAYAHNAVEQTNRGNAHLHGREHARRLIGQFDGCCCAFIAALGHSGKAYLARCAHSQLAHGEQGIEQGKKKNK